MKGTILGTIKAILTLIFLGALVVAGYTAYIKIPDMLSGLVPKKRTEITTGQRVNVSIPKGTSLIQAGALLEEKGVISSKLIFRLVALIRGEQRSIKAGEYEFKTGSDAGDVLDILISGKTRMLSFMIPEGYNIYQMAEVFENKGAISREKFLQLAKDKHFLRELGIQANSLEGYLFPDTYFIRPSEQTDAKFLIRMMVERFHKVYNSEVRPQAEKLGWSVNQVVTLASLIEKEATADEHAKVSAVFHNRLKKRMRLQTDPTVIYGIKPMGSRITYADLRNNHPYNTYVHYGLPPGPIANPGKASLIAAVNPAKVKYLYFVSKNDGTHQFSCSLKEHNGAVYKYQKMNRNQNRQKRSAQSR
jgi:UPF0755 protein